MFQASGGVKLLKCMILHMIKIRLLCRLHITISYGLYDIFNLYSVVNQRLGIYTMVSLLKGLGMKSEMCQYLPLTLVSNICAESAGLFDL